MFTSQRKAWSSLMITPWTEGPRDGTPNPRIAGKGKAVALVDGPPPPRRLLSENEATMAVAGGLETGDVEDWRRFREAGLSSLEAKIIKFGEEMKKNSKLAGVNVNYYEDEAAPTGTCAVCVVGGERSLIANLSAANCYKVDHLKKPENWALDGCI